MTSNSPVGARRCVRVAAFLLPLAALPLSACLPGDSSETPAPGASQSSGPSASASPSLSPTFGPSPSPTGIEPSGPITGPPSGTPVTPEVLFATVDTDTGELRVVVVVPNIYEDDGSCSVTVTGQASTILKEGTGAADASYTACGEFTFSLAQLGSGTASISVEYQSVKYSGKSETTEVQIP